MKPRYRTLIILAVVAILLAGYAAWVTQKGFRATDQPSAVERILARTVRNFGIPRSARNENNPWTATPALLQEARDNFSDRCLSCHGKDGDGRTGIGQNLYPKAPNLQRPETQSLTDGELLHYIIQNGAHTFAFITPVMADKYKIPNPCTSCHTEETTAWATDAMHHWPERSPWRTDQ